MKTIKLFAASALFLAMHAGAAPLTIQPGTLTATPSGQSEGREINFHLPLNGNTANCVVEIHYGEKPGVGVNNDGDTHINGQASLDRVRTYKAGGTYTFTAAAKSGCTGSAQVTFRIPEPASATGRTAPPILAGAQPAAGISAAPGLTIAPTRMTQIVVSSTHLTVGDTATVKLNGVGNPTDAACGSRIEMVQAGQAPQWNGYPGVSQTLEDFSKWPKTQAFVFKQPGKYTVTLGVYAGAPAHCGYSGPGSIPGDLTVIDVVAVAIPR